MKKYLLLLLFVSSTSQAFWCLRRRKDSPKIAPQPAPHLIYRPSINDTKAFNAAKTALKLENPNGAFERLNELTEEHKRDLLRLFFTFYKTPEKSELKDDNLTQITQIYEGDQLPDAWRLYVAKKKKLT